ncbi:hypothetical protein PanWU01x14_038340 [Parasponia andersonii]|uniref:DUF7026 domain-containing protein n=1 Tax=Parasponia andersonii TaxID=3476 RepID=A0A2P5DRG2_PARAD|nr:hypothetical protein PanWU01x14_038340 [Parasponia andersonii]
MALRTHPIPKFPTLQPPHPKPTSPHFSSITFLRNQTKKALTKCSAESSGDSELLASNLTREVAKMSTLLVQRAEAMEKSRDLLFKELCNHLSMDSGEARRRWRKMEEEEKWVLVRGFMSDWGVNFHPLSARSVKELIEEHLHEEEEEGEANASSSKSSSSSSLFPSLKKMIWFSQDE